MKLTENPCVAPFATSALIVARRLPLDDPEWLFYLRAGYISVQLIAIAAYLYTSSVVRLPRLMFSQVDFMLTCRLTNIQIKKKNDQTVLKYGKYFV